MSETNNSANSTRNTYIDACRGIAAISIVAIHTSFYGLPNTPDWFKSLTLFIDVPFFFYLSGWASSYKQPDVIRAGKSILRIWAQWIVFILVLNVFSFISLRLPYSYSPIRGLADLVRCLFFDENISPGFFVIGASTWFIPFYFATILISNALLRLIKDSKRRDKYCYFYIVFLILLMLWAYFHPDYFGYYPPFLMLYGSLWMIGYIRAEKRESLTGFILALCFCAAGLCLFSRLDYRIKEIYWYDLQSSKCLPSGKYLFASFFSILIGGNLERFIEKPNRILAHIGKNALYYFFGQGVGSSVLSYGHISLEISSWGLKWLAYFIINLVITTVVAESVRFIYLNIYKAYRFISTKMRRIN